MQTKEITGILIAVEFNGAKDYFPLVLTPQDDKAVIALLKAGALTPSSETIPVFKKPLFTTKANNAD